MDAWRRLTFSLNLAVALWLAFELWGAQGPTERLELGLVMLGAVVTAQLARQVAGPSTDRAALLLLLTAFGGLGSLFMVVVGGGLLAEAFAEGLAGGQRIAGITLVALGLSNLCFVYAHRRPPSAVA